MARRTCSINTTGTTSKFAGNAVTVRVAAGPARFTKVAERLERPGLRVAGTRYFPPWMVDVLLFASDHFCQAPSNRRNTTSWPIW